MNFSLLAEKYGTPLYVYDFDEMENSFLSLKNAFKARKSLISYAIKANSNLSIISFFAGMGAGADCVSIGEVKRALAAGVPKYKIIFSGVGKKDYEIEEALKADILFLNIESDEEMRRIENIAKILNRKARISIRVNPNVDPKTHPYISTGLHESKFGVDIESAKKMYLHAHNSDHLDPVGIHFHIGSQITELEPFRESSVLVAELLRQLYAAKLEIKFFDVGGGLGIRYKDETTVQPYDYAQAILDSLHGLDVTVICEPGRFLVGRAGFFLTKVLYEKCNGEKRFVIVDGAMNDLIRPSLYGAFHDVHIPGREEELSRADIVGPICESGDFLAKNIELPKTEHNDVVVLSGAGAYSMSMASNYNSRPRAAEVAVFQGKEYLIRERESVEDLWEKEKAFLGSVPKGGTDES